MEFHLGILDLLVYDKRIRGGLVKGAGGVLSGADTWIWGSDTFKGEHF